MAVSKRLRYEILRRDENTCRYCGRSAPEVKLAVDHVTPVALGGTDEPGNLVAACVDCNAGKSSSNPDAPLVAEVDERASQMAQAMEIVLARRQVELQQQRERTASFDATWRQWKAGEQEVPRDGNWRASVLRFMAAGLDDQYLTEAIEIAMRSKVKAADTWRYFCGICWRELDNLQAKASAALSMGPTAVVPDQLPYGPGFHPGFDVLNLAERYVVDLVDYAGLPDDCAKWAVRGLWDGMQGAYAAFMAGAQDGPASDNEAVSRALFAHAAYDLTQLWELCGRPLTAADLEAEAAHGQE